MVQSITALLVTAGSATRPPVHTVSWARGSDGSIVIRVTDVDGEPIDLTGRVVELGLRAYDGAPDPVFVRLAVLTDPTVGVCVVYLNAADTSGLATGTYRFDVWLTDDDGRAQIVKASDFKVLEAVTLVDEGSSSASPIAPMINGSVADLEELALVDASRLTDGFLLWVRDESAYYQIRTDIDDGVPADGLDGGFWTVLVTGDAGGGPATLSRAIPGEFRSRGSAGVEDVVGVPCYLDFDTLADVTDVVCELVAGLKVSAGTGTVRVRMGGTLGAADGTVIAVGTVTGLVYVATAIESVAPFSNPGGLQLVQVTLANNTASATTSMLGAAIEISDASA